ncbi:MAG: hypothetical protein JSU96_04790 [Acidobacteriota bacterium]|nr:MAG: hypothetical protein JSU96_04790 [Acidobacteriota bacterium]
MKHLRSLTFAVLLLGVSSVGFQVILGQNLQITGDDLAWRVENPFIVVDFSPNPRTGRSGQINTVRVKGPDILLSRGTPSSTLHLSPNLAQGGDWVCTNRWDPPQQWEVQEGPKAFRLERSGPMPVVPEIFGETVYEITPDAPVVRVFERMTVQEPAKVALLRVDELSVEPGPENPFTHIAWSTGSGTELRDRRGNPVLPLETQWVAFFSQAHGFAVVSIYDELSMTGPNGGNAVLKNPSLHFAGDPHYFYRAFIFPDESVTGNDTLVQLPAGSVYSIRYSLLFLEGVDWPKIEALIGAFMEREGRD